MIILSLIVSLLILLVLTLRARKQIFLQERILANMMPAAEVRKKLEEKFNGFALCLDITRYPNTRRIIDFICQHIERDKVLIYDISTFTARDIAMFQGIENYYYPSLASVKNGILNPDMFVLNRFDSDFKNRIEEFIELRKD
jgi:hypothetical protein